MRHPPSKVCEGALGPDENEGIDHFEWAGQVLSLMKSMVWYFLKVRGTTNWKAKTCRADRECVQEALGSRRSGGRCECCQLS
jgi:hypothetical protein